MLTSCVCGTQGPVFATAVMAGTMAVKKTSDLIPFCHPLPIDKCNIDVSCGGREHSRYMGRSRVMCVTVRSQVRPGAVSGEFTITCEVGTYYHTGVEMEALTGSSVAALAVYDMCKAVSHDIVITQTKLLSKTGGKSDFKGPTASDASAHS